MLNSHRSTWLPGQVLLANLLHWLPQGAQKLRPGEGKGHLPDPSPEGSNRRAAQSSSGLRELLEKAGCKSVEVWILAMERLRNSDSKNHGKIAVYLMN